MLSFVLAVAVAASVDPVVAQWVDAGANAPDQSAGQGRLEPAAQLEEWSVLLACRDAQQLLTRADQEQLADAFERIGADAHSSLERRRRAWFVVGRLQQVRSVDALLAAAGTPPTVLQAEAIKSLGRFGQQAVYELREVQRDVKRQVVFPGQPVPRVTTFLLGAARASTGPLRAAALEAHWHHGGPQVEALALELLKKKEPAENLLPLFESLRRPDTMRLVTTTLKTGSLTSRRQAAHLLWEWSSLELQPAMLDALRDPDDEVFAQALGGLRAANGLSHAWAPRAAALDRALVEGLWRKRVARGFAPTPKDPAMPAEVAQALELRKREPTRALDLLEQLATRAAKTGDLRTAALARHRAGDVYADLRDCYGATDAYWRALTLHEVRGDDWFAGVAANDLGLLANFCGYATGDSAQGWFEYVAALRRRAGDKEGLRRVLNNLGATMVVYDKLDEARPVLAEALSLSLELKDPAAEWKIRINEAYRVYLACTTHPAMVLAPGEEARVAEVLPLCRFADGAITHTAAAQQAMKEQLSLAVKAAALVDVTPDMLCRSIPGAGQPLCDWLPR